MIVTVAALAAAGLLLLTIAGIQFTHIVDFMIMMPLGPPLTRLFGLSDAQFGLLVSSYTFAAGASALLAAAAVDRMYLFYAPVLLGPRGMNPFGGIPSPPLTDAGRWRRRRRC